MTRRGLVHRVKVQRWSPASDQGFAHLTDGVQAEGFDTGAVITVGFQLLAHPAWNLRTARFTEARQITVVGDRHDARNNRNVAACRTYPIYKVEVSVGVVEVLRDR